MTHLGITSGQVWDISYGITSCVRVSWCDTVLLYSPLWYTLLWYTLLWTTLLVGSIVWDTILLPVGYPTWGCPPVWHYHNSLSHFTLSSAPQSVTKPHFSHYKTPLLRRLEAKKMASEDTHQQQHHKQP